MKISELADEIYAILGDGYGFNGSKEEALDILNDKLMAVAKYYADKAFVAGRSQTSYIQFETDNGL